MYPPLRFPSFPLPLITILRLPDECVEESTYCLGERYEVGVISSGLNQPVGGQGVKGIHTTGAEQQGKWQFMEGSRLF